jgi:ankyrin repeat protein
LLREAKIYYTASFNGTTPLHLACKNNNLEIVKFFIEEMGVDPNEAKDPETKKINPLSITIARGHLDIAKYLVEKGCKIIPEMFYFSCRNPNISITAFVLDQLKHQGFHGDRIEKEIINAKYEKS